ncbi:MAG: extracellular solute-binding protein [Clostridia bacterium]|nr:extracellular solute-binding protein [Clostridia bacterium]
MKVLRRIGILFLAVVLVFCLAACNRNRGDGDVTKDTVELKVWGAQEDQEMLKAMVEEFKKENPDTNYSITFGVVGEKDTQTKILEDPDAAADVFSFPDDQMGDLIKAGVLYEITLDKAAIMSENSEGSVAAATVDNKLYAYPMTADNGYFLYYDKSVLTEEDVKTLDGMLAAAQKKNKKVLMDVSNGWYLASFFLGAGGSLGLENGKQTCDFNNEQGVAAGEAVKAFCAHPAFITGEDAILTGGIGSTIAAGVSGTWTADAIQEKLGDNYAATKLPTFTLNGKQVQMKSFAGYKLMGVNSGTKHPKEAMKLARFLTNEKNQLIRFEKRAMGPSNIKAAADEKVKANVALSALAMQNQYGVSQANVLNSSWDPMEAFGTAMEAKDYKKTVKEYLDTMVSQMAA